MLKENWRFISRLERIGDVVIICLAFVLAYYGRQSLLFWNGYLGLDLPFEGAELAPLKDYLIVLGGALFGYLIVLNWFGAYGSMRLSSAWHLLRISLLSSSIVFVYLAALLFILKIDLSRSFLALLFLLVALGITAERYTVLSLLRYWRRRGMNFRNVIVCGLGEQALRLVSELKNRPELGIKVRAFADLILPSTERSLARQKEFREKYEELDCGRSTRILQGTQAVAQALNDYAINEVIFTDVVDIMPQVEELVLLCSEQGVRATIAADLFSIGLVKSGLSYFGDIPLIHFQTPPGDKWELVVKRILDLLISGVLLFLCAPLFLIIALLVKLDSSGPVFFIQRRVGLNGKIFSLYKFRSMFVNAHEQLENLRAQNEMEGPAFKLKNDPRVTRFGKILRRYSLDELPQLWNVLVGDMSLVGPRPPVPEEVTLYQRRYRRRLSMRPGLTCIWQVSGRNEIKDFQTWVKLDLEYIDNWSLQRDFMLLFKTIPAVLFGTGAR